MVSPFLNFTQNPLAGENGDLPGYGEEAVDCCTGAARGTVRGGGRSQGRPIARRGDAMVRRHGIGSAQSARRRSAPCGHGVAAAIDGARTGRQRLGARLHRQPGRRRRGRADPHRLRQQEAFFPESTVGISAAVEYVNAELGGAGGRPIELVECQVDAVADGAACGAQFANDDSIAARADRHARRRQQGALRRAQRQQAADHRQRRDVDDFVTPAGQSFTAGAVGVVAGMAKFVLDDLQPRDRRVVANDNAGGQAGANLLVKPALDAAGVQSSLVVRRRHRRPRPTSRRRCRPPAPSTADVFISLVTLPGCIDTYDAIQLARHRPDGRDHRAVLRHADDRSTSRTSARTATCPDGWYFGDYGYSYFIPDDESGMATYLAKVQEYGEPSPAPRRSSTPASPDRSSPTC